MQRAVLRLLQRPSAGPDADGTTTLLNPPSERTSRDGRSSSGHDVLVDMSALPSGSMPTILDESRASTGVQTTADDVQASATSPRCTCDGNRLNGPSVQLGASPVSSPRAGSRSMSNQLSSIHSPDRCRSVDDRGRIEGDQPGSRSCEVPSDRLPLLTGSPKRKSRALSHSVSSSSTCGGEQMKPPMSCSASARPCAPSASGSEDQPVCLVCLDSLDLDDVEKGDVVHLGCACSGAAAYRHKRCIMEWVRVKGNTTCDVCKTEMTNITLPPPPPVPYYVVFPDIEEDFRSQCNMFARFVAHHTMQGMIYFFVICILLNAPILIGLVGGLAIAIFITLRCLIMLAYNAAVGRSVLRFESAEPLTDS